MSAAYIEIRRLTEADAVLYRDIRLEALRANPEAFGSTFETENAQPLSSFSTTLGNSTVLGAFATRSWSPSPASQSSEARKWLIRVSFGVCTFNLVQGGVA